jgi:hypothetical protein
MSIFIENDYLVIKTDIETQLEAMNPDEVDRKKRIDFSSWLSQNAAGA